MSLKYSDEKLSAMAKSFLGNYSSKPEHKANCDQLLNMLSHYFKMSKDAVLVEIEVYAAMEFD